MTQNRDHQSEEVATPAQYPSQSDPQDTLDDRGVEDVLDEGITAPEKWSAGEGFGTTAAEERQGESLDERLRQEIPDVGEGEVGEDIDDGEVGNERAGRLVDPDQGTRTDVEKDMVGEDVGIDGAGAGAEEAAVHVIDED